VVGAELLAARVQVPGHVHDPTPFACASRVTALAWNLLDGCVAGP
jgi:hypothetical protein